MSKPTNNPADRSRPAGLKLWLGRLALLALAPLFLLALELALRAGGYGRATDFFIPDGTPGIFRTNPRFTETYFPASFGLKPLNFRLPRQKPAGETRVFVVGESAAMGVPEPGFGLAPQLRAQLRAAFPGRALEVYNLGITAINSHAIVPIVRQAAGFQPDLLVIYMGNNEVVGPYGPSSVATRGMPPRGAIRASLWLRRTRVGQLVEQAVRALRPASAGLPDWRGMEMFAGKTVASGDPRLEAVYANFRANLDEILGVARAAGIPVVLSTVAVNVKDSAPFASEHAAGLAPAQRAAWEQAVAHRDYAAAAQADPHYAASRYQYAQALEQQGDAAAARREYLAALQEDALRFRADARINAAIREVAAASPQAVTLVDAAAAMGAAASSSGPPAGNNFFFEHVHLNWAGNCELARICAQASARALGRENAAWLSDADCAAAVGYTDFGRAVMTMGMERLTGRPPFISQLSYGAHRQHLREEIAAANQAVSTRGTAALLAQVEAARQRDPANAFLCFHAATLRLQRGDLAGALELNTQLDGLQPASPEAVAQRAFILQRLGRVDEAEKLLLQSAQESPFYFQTYSLLARLWSVEKQGDKAVDYFSALVRRMPDSVGARHALASALAGKGDRAAAEAQWQAILHLVPDDEGALGPLVTRWQEQGREAAAIDLMRTARTYNPRSFPNNMRLLQAMDGQGDPAQLVALMQDIAANGPAPAALSISISELLRQLGRTEEAQAELQHALDVALAADDTEALATIRKMTNNPGPTPPGR